MAVDDLWDMDWNMVVPEGCTESQSWSDMLQTWAMAESFPNLDKETDDWFEEMKGSAVTAEHSGGGQGVAAVRAQVVAEVHGQARRRKRREKRIQERKKFPFSIPAGMPGGQKSKVEPFMDFCSPDLHPPLTIAEVVEMQG